MAAEGQLIMSSPGSPDSQNLLPTSLAHHQLNENSSLEPGHSFINHHSGFVCFNANPAVAATPTHTCLAPPATEESPPTMAPYMYVERAHRSYGAVDKEALTGRLSKSERAMLRMGLVKSEQWRQLPTEGLYQIIISEVLDNGVTYPLERSGGRAFAVTSVLDLGLRMLESARGRGGT